MILEVLSTFVDAARISAGIRAVMELAVHTYQWLRQLWGERRISPESLVQAPMSEEDLEMCEKTGQTIREIFGDDVYERVEDASYSERIALAEEMVQKLTEVYGLELEPCRLFVDSNETNCGGYEIKERRINLNIAAMFSEDEAQVYELLDTIVHELRHAVQWEAVRTADFWNMDGETRDRWRENFMNYVSPGQDINGYIHQPVEEDARTFAYHSMKGVRKDEE